MIKKLVIIAGVSAAIGQEVFKHKIPRGLPRGFCFGKYENLRFSYIIAP